MNYYKSIPTDRYLVSLQEEEDGEERRAVELPGFTSGQHHVATNIIAALHAIAATSTASSVAAAIASTSASEHQNAPPQAQSNVLDSNLTLGRSMKLPTLSATHEMSNPPTWTAFSDVAGLPENDRNVDTSIPGLTFFNCCYCSRQFIYKSLLERHLRTHTNERPFKCDLCMYRAKHKANLKSHYIFKHPEKTSDLRGTPSGDGL